MVFETTYKEECHEFCKASKKILNIIKFFSQNKVFKRWLEYILKFGNYLNGISIRGGAYAFKLDTLIKLVELKSNDNSKNLLQFIIETIANSKEDVDLLKFNFDLESIEGGIIKILKFFL